MRKISVLPYFIALFFTQLFGDNLFADQINGTVSYDENYF